MSVNTALSMYTTKNEYMYKSLDDDKYFFPLCIKVINIIIDIIQGDVNAGNSYFEPSHFTLLSSGYILSNGISAVFQKL
jgi:hypothetical protein